MWTGYSILVYKDGKPPRMVHGPDPQLGLDHILTVANNFWQTGQWSKIEVDRWREGRIIQPNVKVFP